MSMSHVSPDSITEEPIVPSPQASSLVDWPAVVGTRGSKEEGSGAGQLQRAPDLDVTMRLPEDFCQSADHLFVERDRIEIPDERVILQDVNDPAVNRLRPAIRDVLEDELWVSLPKPSASVTPARPEVKLVCRSLAFASTRATLARRPATNKSRHCLEEAGDTYEAMQASCDDGGFGSRLAFRPDMTSMMMPAVMTPKEAEELILAEPGGRGMPPAGLTAKTVSQTDMEHGDVNRLRLPVPNVLEEDLWASPPTSSPPARAKTESACRSLGLSLRALRSPKAVRPQEPMRTIEAAVQAYEAARGHEEFEPRQRHSFRQLDSDDIGEAM